MNQVAYDPRPENERPRGGLWLAGAIGLALCWAGAVTYGAYLQAGPELLRQPPTVLANFAALALCPAAALVFAGLCAREAARAGAKAERLADIAATLIDPAYRTIDASDRAASLRNDIVALDRVIEAANERMHNYTASLRRDGVTLARALKTDVDSMRTLRGEMNAEAQALAGAFGANTEALRVVSAELKREAAEANKTVAAQLDAFGAAFAQIGARSAEFAAAATRTQNCAASFESAVDKALGALAHATSITDSARKSTEESALVAHETARALRDATARAVAEAREASRLIRTEGRAPVANDDVFSGRHAPENIRPRRTLGGFFKLRAPKTAEPVSTPAPANDYSANLADIVRLAGVDASMALSPGDLAHIARAGKSGVEARRNAVRHVARTELSRLSSTFRSSADARHAAEILRRCPALGEDCDAHTQRDLMSAFLLVDAALG